MITGPLAVIREVKELYWPTKGKKRKKRLFTIFILCAFVVSAGALWGIEHKKVVDLERQLSNNIPKLSATFNQIAASPAGKNNESSILTVVMLITNTGAQSIVKDFEIVVTRKEKQIKGVPISPPQKIILWKNRNKKEGILLNRTDYLPDKCMTQPIVTNGGAGGFIQNFIPGVSVKEIFSDAVIVLNFRDAFDKKYSASYDFKMHQNDSINVIWNPSLLQGRGR